MGKNPILNIIFNFSLLEFYKKSLFLKENRGPKLEGCLKESSETRVKNVRKSETFSSDFQTLCALALFCDTEFHQLFTVLC